MQIYQGDHKKGFSLIEVLASMLLLAGLISIMVQLSYGNTRRMKKSFQLEKIAQLLELKMRELEDTFRGKDIINLPEQDQGEFQEDTAYSWSYETQDLGMPPADLLLSLVKLPNNELNTKMIDILVGVFSETVVEMKLSVYYNNKKEKKLHYSLTSYFINYEDAPDFIFNRLRGLLPAGSSL